VTAADRGRFVRSWRLRVALKVIMPAAGLWILVYLVGCRWTGFRHWIFVDADFLTTLLQVVPATVVAVFVFAAGAVFVVAQVIHSPLGSRGVEELLLSRRVYAAIVAGVFLLFGSVVLVFIARPAGKTMEFNRRSWPYATLTGSEVTEPAAGELDYRVASAGTVLAVASAVYALLAIWGIVVVLSDFVYPERYMKRLIPFEGKSTRATAENLYRAVRALRQWLRISCGSGESRDLMFALLGMRELVTAYIAFVDREPRPVRASPARRRRAEPATLRATLPAEYLKEWEIVRLHWRHPGRPGEAPSVPDERPGWFGDELGRAFARSLETGILGGSLLLRDADRLLGLMCWAVEQFSGLDSDGSSATELHEEAGYVLDRIAEIGLFGRMSPDSHFQEWCFHAASCALLRFAGGPSDTKATGVPEPRCGHVDGKTEKPRSKALADRALAGWILVVNEELRRTADGAAEWPPVDAADWCRRLDQAGLIDELRAACGPPADEVEQRPSAPVADLPTVDRLVVRLTNEVRWMEAGRAGAAPGESLKELTEVVVGNAVGARMSARPQR